MSGCPAFSTDGPAGIADALRSVDCMIEGATGAAFSRLFGTSGALGTALTLCLTLYVGLMAIGLLTGRTSLSLSSLTPRALGLGLVLTFATSWVAYQSVVWNLLAGAPDQIASLVAGTRGSATMLFANRLDMLFGVIANAAQTAQNATAEAQKQQSFTPADLLWLASLMLLLGTVGVLIVSRIALAALLALGPVFIVLSLFRGSRGLFEGWLKAAVLFALVPLFTVLLGGGALAMLTPIVRSLEMADGEPSLRLAVTVFLGASVYCALMAMVLKVATTLTAGWRLPWVGEHRLQGRDASPNADARHAPFSVPAPAQGGNAQDRVRATVAGLGAPANDRVPLDDNRMRTRLFAVPSMTLQENSTAMVRRDDRARGLGNSFRAPSSFAPGKEPRP